MLNILFKNPKNANEAINLIKIASIICFLYACYCIIIVWLFLDISKIPLALSSVFILAGIGLMKSKSREIALFVFLISAFLTINDALNNHFNLSHIILLFAGIEALRGSLAYYYFNKASIKIQNIFAKLLISLIYYLVLGVIVVSVNPIITGFPLSQEIFGTFFSIINYLGFAGILPLTNKFKIVSYNI